MKMPIIKVTPSSPSPDPNHPDYPEFFEDKLYLDHIKAVRANQDNVDTTKNKDPLDTNNPTNKSLVQNHEKMASPAIFCKSKTSTEISLVLEEDDQENKSLVQNDDKIVSPAIFSKPKTSNELSLVWEEDDEKNKSVGQKDDEIESPAVVSKSTTSTEFSLVLDEENKLVGQKDGKVGSPAIFSKPNTSSEFSLVWEEDDEEEEVFKPHEQSKEGCYLDDSIEICFESLGKQRDDLNMVDSQEFIDSQAMCDNVEVDSQTICDNVESPENDLVDTNISDEADTPEIETQIKIAKKRNLSPSVMQSLQKHAKICDNVVFIDHDEN